MESLRIDIINPKALSILQNLADLDLIKIKKDFFKSEFSELLKKIRNNSENPLSLDEIAMEVEIVRKSRYEE